MYVSLKYERSRVGVTSFLQFLFQTSKWYPLLLAKYQKNKPEIRLAIYLDEDKTAEPDTSFKAKEAPPRCKTVGGFHIHHKCVIWPLFSSNIQ